MTNQTMMNQNKAVIVLAATVLAALSWSGPARSQAVKTTPPVEMAPIEQYRIATREDEIALARSAAPPSISADAEVLVLGNHGYETALKGKNGFVCFVERSWAAGLDDPEFWNPRIRSPNCFNPPAARTELPQYLQRTEWVLAGATRQQVIARTTAAVASHSFKPLEAGAFSFMLTMPQRAPGSPMLCFSSLTARPTIGARTSKVHPSSGKTAAPWNRPSCSFRCVAGLTAHLRHRRPRNT
jgi:hypothetical protein